MLFLPDAVSASRHGVRRDLTPCRAPRRHFVRRHELVYPRAHDATTWLWLKHGC